MPKDAPVGCGGAQPPAKAGCPSGSQAVSDIVPSLLKILFPPFPTPALGPEEAHPCDRSCDPARRAPLPSRCLLVLANGEPRRDQRVGGKEVGVNSPAVLPARSPRLLRPWKEGHGPCHTASPSESLLDSEENRSGPCCYPPQAVAPGPVSPCPSHLCKPAGHHPALLLSHPPSKAQFVLGPYQWQLLNVYFFLLVFFFEKI